MRCCQWGWENASYYGTLLFFVQSTRCLQGEWVGPGQVKYPGNTSNTCPARLQEILRREGRMGGGGLVSKMWKTWNFTAITITIIAEKCHSHTSKKWKMSHLCGWGRPYSSHITAWRNTEWLLRSDFLTFHLKNSCIFCTLYFGVSFHLLRVHLCTVEVFVTGYNFHQPTWSSSSAEILKHTDAPWYITLLGPNSTLVVVCQ